jgi:hypothetical protein
MTEVYPAAKTVLRLFASRTSGLSRDLLKRRACRPDACRSLLFLLLRIQNPTFTVWSRSLHSREQAILQGKNSFAKSEARETRSGLPVS